jgi:hypothetical protein
MNFLKKLFNRERATPSPETAEEKANWDCVDAGVAHFFKNGSGEWVWECQFC